MYYPMIRAIGDIAATVASSGDRDKEVEIESATDPFT